LESSFEALILRLKTIYFMIKLQLYFLLVLLSFSFAGLQAQLNCSYDARQAFLQGLDSGYGPAYRQLRQKNSIKAGQMPLPELIPNNAIQGFGTGATNSGAYFYVIPVVFHIIHDSSDNSPGTGSNVPDTQIYNQLEVLNSIFEPYHIRFCLAKYDSDSQAISGISRRAHILAQYRMGIDNDALMGIDALPYDRYLNIWVVKRILNDDGTPSNYLGSAAYVNPLKMGVLVRYDFLGSYDPGCLSCSFDTSSRGKVLVHEIGHLFGLEHVHLGGCAGDSASNCSLEGDYICDTPPMLQGSGSCSSVSNSCQDHLNGKDPINNFMAYKMEDCLQEFTPGQTHVMYYNIENYFKGLIDIDNLKLTTGNQCGATTAMFKVDKYLLCKSEVVEFRTAKSGLTYQWILYNNNTQTTYNSSWLTDSIYNHIFTVTGLYDVTLVVVNTNGDTLKRQVQKLIQFLNCGEKIKSPRGNWYFGMYAGLEFRQYATIPNDSAFYGNPGTIYTYEGSILQNDNRGNLLFYGGGDKDLIGDGFYLFNRKHKYIPNGRLMGSWTSAQGGIIVPMPGDTNRYYIFITNNDNYTGPQEYGLRYTLLDKTLDSGFGGLVSGYKDRPVYPPLGRSYNRLSDSSIRTGEGIGASPGCDSSYYYLIVTSMGTRVLYNGAYYTYNDSNLLSSTIEIYKVTASGLVHHKQYRHTELFNPNGAIVFSNDGRLVSVCGLLFEFDRQNGELKFLVNLQAQQGAGVETNFCHSKFSPDSRLFYLVNHIAIGDGLYRKELRQYDLSNGQWTSTSATLKDNAYNLQTGPDNRIYVSQMNDHYISVVEYPDSINNLQDNNRIGLVQDKINLKIGNADMRSMGGFPNFIDAGSQTEITKRIYTRVTDCNNYYFYTSQCCASSYIWYFGDGDTAHGATAWHSYSGKTGTFYVRLLIDGSVNLYDTVRFGISGFGISGMKTICDTTVPTQYTVRKPVNALGKYRYYYDWAVTGGEKETEFPYTNAVHVKWKAATGQVRLIVTDVYGCKDSSVLDFTLDNTVINNTISRLYNCQKQFIKGSTPSSGNYMFSWKQSNDGINYQDLTGVSTRDYTPVATQQVKYYKRTVYTNGCYFESRPLMLPVFKFENKIFASKSGNDTCTEILYGSDVTTYFSSGTYNWEYSVDKVSWSSLLNTSQNLFRPVDTVMTYYRRKVTTDSCIVYSNVAGLQGAKMLKQPKRVAQCSDDLFPATYEYNIYNPTGVPITRTLQVRQADSANWKTLNISFLSDSGFTLFSSFQQVMQPGTHYIHLAQGDSFRLRISYFCTNAYLFYSQAIALDYSVYPQILVQPQSGTVSGGDLHAFNVLVNDSGNVHYLWQVADGRTGPWVDIENSDTSRLDVSTGNCQKDTLYYRVQVQGRCDTLISDTVSLVINPSTNPQTDYYLKDTETDIGLEPNPNDTVYAASKDIWIRYRPDGIKMHQELNPDLDTNYVYVQIRNRGKNSIKSGRLYAYWTWGATDESWPVNWTENINNLYSLPNRVGVFYMGGEINKTGILIPEIPKNGSYNIAIPWTSFPKRGWYNLNDQKWENERINVCLLARIETCDVAPYGMTYAETNRVKDNIISNNNIISRNTYSINLFNPVINSDQMDNHQQERMALNPNTKDGGVILVRNNSSITGRFNLCLKTGSAAYFELAETYIEIDDQLKWTILNSPGVAYSGISHIYGNIYQVTSVHACISNILLPAGFLGQIEPFFAYKDINNRFTDKQRFTISIAQSDSNFNETGICYYTISDNIYFGSEYRIIERDTLLSICINGTSPSSLNYQISDTLPYQLSDSSAQVLEPLGENLYQLHKGEYILKTDDSLNFIRHITYIHVETEDEDTTTAIQSLQFDCMSLPFEYQIFSDSAVIRNNNNQLLDTGSYRHYSLDPIHQQYQIEYKNHQLCKYQITALDMYDVPVSMPESPIAVLMADYDLSEDSCAFVKLNSITCENDTIRIGQEFKVYTMDFQYRFTASVEQYGEFTKGFRFCPPYWDTSANQIHNWQALIYKTNLCAYCRIDFKADTNNVFHKTTLNHSLKDDYIQMYPNPTTGELILDFSNAQTSGSIDIYITDNFGKTIQIVSYNGEDPLIFIDLSDCAEGMYYITIPELGYYSKIVLIKQ